MMMETMNWNVIRTFLRIEWDAPAFSAPVSTATGLKDDRMKAGYPPAAIPVSRAMARRVGTSQGRPVIHLQDLAGKRVELGQEQVGPEPVQ